MKSNTCLYTTLPIQHTLGTLVEEKYCNRDLILPSVELAFNNSVNHCTGKSQFEIVYDLSPHQPFDHISLSFESRPCETC